MRELPEPKCRYGYPSTQLEDELGWDEFSRLGDWMYGQTMAICAGEGETEAHGTVLYTWDVDRYFRGLPITD